MKHGISLRTLLRNSAKLSGPGLLVCQPFMSKKMSVFCYGVHWRFTAD